MNPFSKTRFRAARAPGAGIALLVLALAASPAPLAAQSACTAGTPTSFEPNPPGTPRVATLSGSYSSSLVLYQNASGANRMMMNETFGYSVLDLTNPGSPYALLYDDFRTDPSNANTNPLQQHGDGQSAIQTFGVSPDGQRATFSVNGPFDPPWHTIGARNYGLEGFGLWGDFAPNRALGTVVQHVNGRYIAYAIHGSNNMTAADITTLPSALAPYDQCTPGTSCQAYDTTGFPPAYAPPLLLVGNYIVYQTGTYPNPALTVIDASNPGSPGGIASPFKSVTIPSLTSDPHSRSPQNFTAALDPGDSTKLWILVEVAAASGEAWPSYGLVAVTKDGSGNLTATASTGLVPVSPSGSGTWQSAGNASSLVALGGKLFVIMWAHRTSAPAQYGFVSVTSDTWPNAGPFQAVSVSNLPQTHASVLAGSGTSAYQYFPTGPSAYAIPLTCAPINPKATSTLTASTTYGGVTVPVPNNGTVWIGDQVDIAAAVVPLPSQSQLVGGGGFGVSGWNFDFDFHSGFPAEDAGATPRIKEPDNGFIGSPSTPPASTITLVGPCDPQYVPTPTPGSGAGCWASVQGNASFGGPDFTGSEVAGMSKPTTIAMEAQNQYGTSGTTTLTINWKVPAAKVASTQILSGGNPLVGWNVQGSASDGHPATNGYRWYFGTAASGLGGPTHDSACDGLASCVSTLYRTSGSYYYYLTVTYNNGFSTPDYDGSTHVGLPFKISDFVPAFTVGGSAAGPITALINSSVNVVNNSQRGSGISATYQYSLCTPAGSCADNYQTFNIGDTPAAPSSITLPGAVGTYALKIKATYTGGLTATWPDPAGTAYFQINAVNIPATTAAANPNPVAAGSSVTLTCSATNGTPPYTGYAWYLNGSQVSTANPYTFTATNGGATDVTYPVTCTATDSNFQTSQQSPVLNLTILHSVKPVVTATVYPTTVVGGNPATFTCGATGGTGTGYTYQWFAAVGGVISTQSSFSFTFNNTTGSNLTEQLWCSVTDSASATGTSPSPATLTVTSSSSGPPSGSLTVTASANPNPASAGQPTTFSCSATGGSGSYAYAWFVAGVGNAISSQQNYTYTPSSPGSLALTCSVTDTASSSRTGQSTVNLSVVQAGPACPAVDFKVYSNGTQLQAGTTPFGITIPMSANLGDLLAFSISSGVSSHFDWNFGDNTPHAAGLASDSTVNFARHAFTSGGTFTVTLRPMYADDSGYCGGTSYPIQVVGPTGLFSAAYEDASPITYTQVTAYKNIVFTALDSPSLVDAGAYAWDFGDGYTTNGSSTATHPYAPGTWTAKLTVQKNGFPVTTTLALTVPAPPEPPKWVVPGMAYVNGATPGTTWQSDVTILNPSTLSAKYSVAFLDARNPVTDYSQLTWTSFTVPPLNVIDSGNLLAGPPFNQTIGAYGALMVRGDIAPLPPVITARTFNNAIEQGKGTFGLSVPQSSVSGGVSTQAAPAASALIGLRQNDSAYTNIGLVNLHNDWATVELDFFDGLTAADLGTLTVQINPYQSSQINKALLDGRFVPAAGYSASSNLYSVLVKVTQGTGVYPYATVIDTGTTDPIVVTPTAAPANSYRIPGIVRLTGANGELWRSRVTITNPSTASRKVHTVFSYQACIAGVCSSLNSTVGDVTFAPGQTQSWDDFVNVWLTHFGFIGVSDTTSYQNTFLDVSPGDADSDPLVVLGETYNATPAGHVGLQIPGYTPLDGASSAGAYKRLALTGLAQSAAYRTNLALVVLAGTSGKWANIHVLSAQGTDLNDIPVYVDGVSQVGAGTLFAGVSGDLSRVSIVIDNIDAGVTIGAYATIIDNTSGDATFVKATPTP